VRISLVIRKAVALWAMKSIPIDRIGAYFIAVFLISGLCLLQDFPFRLPGLAIGVLGAGAVVLSVRANDMTTWEKTGWICVAFLLLVAEVRALYRDREEQNATFISARLAEDRNFGQIANGIDATIAGAQKQFEETMKRSNALLGISRESLDNITGGDSYTFVAAAIGPGPPFPLAVWVKGKHGVHDVSASIQQRFGEEPGSIRRQIESMRGLQLGSNEFLPGVTLTKEVVSPGRYFVSVITRNGSVSEEIDIARCSDGMWNEAIRMNGAPGRRENKIWNGRPGCHAPFSM
jgi:hypothetical protein